VTHVLPEWATSLRPHQADAVERVLEGFARGHKVGILDAPTGTGKTLVADVVGQELGGDRLYVCSGIELQHQVARDFPAHPVLKGRSNYRTELDTAATCDRCLQNACHLCESMHSCPYMVAKEKAAGARAAVLNTAYLLTEGNRTRKSRFEGRGLVIADECDLLEQELMRFTELRIGKRVWNECDVTPPKKGQHYATIKRKLDEELLPQLVARRSELLSYNTTSWTVDLVRRLDNAIWSCEFALKTLGSDNWVRVDYPGGLLMKPVRVKGWGQQYIWKLGQKWLCMSGTVISPDQFAEDLGLSDDEWFSVEVGMTFPVENRPITFLPTADMSRKNAERDMPRLLDGIRGVLERHPGDRVLIHSVSYALTSAITEALTMDGTRPVWSYRDRDGRGIAVDRYRRHARSVLVAPSMDRGVDFKDEDCRAVIVAKIPFPNLGDPQIERILHTPGGERWYTVQTVRTLVQMTGRGVRSEDDHAAGYILDRQAFRLWREHRGLFPTWWQDAVSVRARL
jgi:Rad3-related DNA helicase